MTFKQLCLVLLLFCLVQPVFNQNIYTTVQDGPWGSPTTWTTTTTLPNCLSAVSGPPTYVSSFFPTPVSPPNWFTTGTGDIIVIRHTVTLDYDLFVRDSDIVIIDSCGVLTAGGQQSNSSMYMLSSGQTGITFNGLQAGLFVFGELNLQYLRTTSNTSVDSTGMVTLTSGNGGNGTFEIFGDIFVSGMINIINGNLEMNQGDLWGYQRGSVDIIGNGSTTGNYNNRSVTRALAGFCIQAVNYFNLSGAVTIGGGNVSTSQNVDNSVNPQTSWNGTSWCAGGQGINIPAGLQDCNSPCSVTSCASFGLDVVTACDSFLWIDGNTYYASTTAPIDTLVNAAMCDSIVNLSLTILNSTSSIDTVVACDSYTWIDGNTYTSSTSTPTITIMNAAGCDSVITLHLTLNSSTSSSQTVTACDSYSWNGNTYALSGTYSTTIPNAAGCDSVMTLNLTLNASTSSTVVISACDSYTWIDGNTYTSSTNTPTFITTNTVGCDSLITLDLTIDNSSSSTDSATACDSYLWLGNTFLSSGTYFDTLTNATGCDSLLTLHLTINSVSDSVINNSPTLTAYETNATYQWYDCNNGFVAITGETGQSYLVTATGEYAVVVTQNGCTDTSECIFVTTVGRNGGELLMGVKVYPNPNRGQLRIDLGREYEDVEIRVMNVIGQTVFQRWFPHSKGTELELQGGSGMYLLEIRAAGRKPYVGKILRE